MRVLVASDGIGALTSAQAGAALASGWAGADVRVLPVGDSGHGFLTAYADLLGAEVEIAVEDGYAVTSARADGDVVLQVSAPQRRGRLPLTASSRPLGHGAGPDAGRPRPDRVLLDLSRPARCTTAARGCWPDWAYGRTRRSIRASSRWPR